ncbi:MAG: MMPL family transporter [Clostridiales bacterium]|nr:MMPL family transporter [Clostridiales bacterium]
MRDSTVAMVCFIAAILVSIIGSFIATGEVVRTIMLGLSFAFGAVYMTSLALMQKDDTKKEDRSSVSADALEHSA